MSQPFQIDGSLLDQLDVVIKRTQVQLSEKDQKLFKLLDQGQKVVLESLTNIRVVPSNRSHFLRVERQIEEVEDQAISFKVLSPVSRDGHYYYEIQTKLYPKGVLHQLTVQRRYNDFKLLQEYLFMNHGVAVFLFPMPEGEGAISKILSSSLETLEKRRAQFEQSLMWLKEYQNVLLRDEVFIDFYKNTDSFHNTLAKRLQTMKKDFPDNYAFLSNNYSRLFKYPLDFALESNIEESRRKLDQIYQTNEILNEYLVALENRFPKSIPKSAKSPQIYDEMQRLLNNVKQFSIRKTEITLRISTLQLELHMMVQLFQFISEKRDYLAGVSNTNTNISKQRAEYEKIVTEQAKMYHIKADLIFSNILAELKEIFDN